MEVTPSSSVRTVKPATAVANHRKVRRRENAGRSSQIAFHQSAHSDIGPTRCCFDERCRYPGTHRNNVESLVIGDESMVSLAPAVLSSSDGQAARKTLRQGQTPFRGQPLRRGPFRLDGTRPRDNTPRSRWNASMPTIPTYPAT